MDCEKECCKEKIAHSIFLTPAEKNILKRLKRKNKNSSCKFFNSQYLCDIYSQRPIDFRLYPFDILKRGGKFFWIVWNNSCPITESRSGIEFEPYLQEQESKIIPKFKKCMDTYSQFRKKEFINNFGEPIVLREIII